MDIEPVKFLHLEKKTALVLKKLRLKKSRLLVAVSGGRDSMALLRALETIAPTLGLTIAVAHVHHGRSEDFKQQTYRDQTLQWLSDHFGENLVFRKWQGSPLTSEASLRAFRKVTLEEMREERQCEFVVQAHHLDDLLETRLIRLLRGVGPQGLRAMNVQGRRVLRPWLHVRRQEIEEYSRMRNLEWREDPSNRQNSYFRNWIRNHWIPQLEEKRAGSVEALGRSLEILSGLVKSAPLNKLRHIDGGLDRVGLAELSFRDQRRVIAAYFRESELRNYSLNHIDELIKRLQSRRTEGEFTLLKRKWQCDAKRLRVLPEA